MTTHSSDKNDRVAKAKSASYALAALSCDQRAQILADVADAIVAHKTTILRANTRDVDAARRAGNNESFLERLTLTEKKIADICNTIRDIIVAPEVVGTITDTVVRPRGITIAKQRVPLGLVAIIYESRPNVTVDAFTMAMKSGNAVIIRGGKEIIHTNAVMMRVFRRVLRAHSLTAATITDMSGGNHSDAIVLMQDSRIDCLIPRGGKKLIDTVVRNATVPVIITGASVVHTYVDADADIALAARVVTNAKTRRVSICNALDVVLVHRDVLMAFLCKVAPLLQKHNVTLRADRVAYAALKKIPYSQTKRATQKDFDTEFLSYTLAVKTVPHIDAAIAHIRRHSLGHSEAIITKNIKKRDYFFHAVDAACLYHNTSTQFSDGGEFGLGGEVGISTQKLHARGPFAYESLTTYKYLITSNGATRP